MWFHNNLPPTVNTYLEDIKIGYQDMADQFHGSIAYIVCELINIHINEGLSRAMAATSCFV